VTSTEVLDDEIDDETLNDSSVAREAYSISSFGIDFDVEGLVRRLKADDILVPHFQRNYVWKQREASQFIESLLLGLPVPGIFLAKERDTQKLLIIDGQQRLKTLQFFYGGFFNPTDDAKKQKVFELIDVQREFKNLTYQKLDSTQKRRLDNSVIHATVIKQESPDEIEDTSLFYIFGRLNAGGRKLTPQEIRSAIYHGPLDDLIERLNETPEWRKIFGKQSERLKDQELIVRFLALYFDMQKYQRPMAEFLNQFYARHKGDGKEFLKSCESIFLRTIALANAALGKDAFRPARTINAAVFDAVAVGLARRLEKGSVKETKAIRSAYDKLSANKHFRETTSRATSDDASVLLRLELATEAFKKVP
jgi:uncharacterized protein with ParB-like and HNH nuclease domain